MTYNNKFDLGQFITYLLVFTVLVLIISLGTGCHIQKRIEEAKKEAVRLDRALNPCSNDTIFRLVPGEQLVLIDTVHHFTTDTFFNFTYDTAIITKTIRKVDTIKAFIRDEYKINSLKDSINVHKQAESDLIGQLSQSKINSLESEKTSRNRLIIIIALSLLILVGICMYFKSKL